MIEALNDFTARHRHGSNEYWLSGLVDGGWLTMDWPVRFGGPGLDREEKLHIISSLALAGCPLFPDAVTVIAPMLMTDSLTDMNDSDLQNCLQDIRLSPLDWFLEVRDNTCFVSRYSDPGPAFQTGESGLAEHCLAISASPLFQIQELKTSLVKIDAMARYWQQPELPEVTELNILLAGLEAMYLQNDPMKDLQALLKTSEVQMQTFSILFELVGYYALLDPDPVQMANEQIPFPAERAHLARLGKSIARSDIVQRDLIYQRGLDTND